MLRITSRLKAHRKINASPCAGPSGIEVIKTTGGKFTTEF